MRQIVIALMIADFRERSRQPSYFVVLLAMIALAYLAIPEPDSLWHIFQAGDFRGVYNSAWVGTVTALASSVWLSLAGFYVVRGSINRDLSTGVGEILATTPMSRTAYLAGKFFSNLLVMASMTGVLALAATGIQIWRGESYAINPIELLAPMILLTIPVLSVIAAVAVLLETIPFLRGGFGNVIWVFAWMVGMIVAQTAGIGFDTLGLGLVTDSLRADINAITDSEQTIEFGVGLVERETVPQTFVWAGASFSVGFILERAIMLVGALGIAVLGATWFHRFDTARETRGAHHDAVSEPTLAVTGPAATIPATSSISYRAMTAATFGPRLPRLVLAELRVLISGATWWWWTVVAGLNGIAMFVAQDSVPAVMLPLIWAMPVLLWSRIGTQERDSDVLDLLSTCPGETGRWMATIASGVVLGVLVSAVPALRMLTVGDFSGLTAWATGALFIPSLALALGSVTSSARPFQVVYIVLWYTVLNSAAEIDFMGAVRDSAGNFAGPGTGAVLALSGLFIGLSIVVSTFRHARR